MPHTHETNGVAICAASFAIARAGAYLARFDPDDEPVAVGMIDAAAMVALDRHIAFTPGMAAAALAAGAPILCDARMVRERFIRRDIPPDDPVIRTLHLPAVPDAPTAPETPDAPQL